MGRPLRRSVGRGHRTPPHPRRSVGRAHLCPPAALRFPFGRSLLLPRPFPNPSVLSWWGELKGGGYPSPREIRATHRPALGAPPQPLQMPPRLLRLPQPHPLKHPRRLLHPLHRSTICQPLAQTHPPCYNHTVASPFRVLLLSHVPTDRSRAAHSNSPARDRR